MWATSPLSLTLFGVGVLFHLLVVKQREWHLDTPKILPALLAYYTGTTALIAFVSKVPYFQALWESAILLLTFSAGLFTSMTIYRGVFHPLRSFPGPKLAGITKFWHVWHCLSAKNYLVLDSLRPKYGKIVRTGPNELTIFDTAAINAIREDRGHEFSKPDFYDFLYPLRPLNGIRNNKVHDERRRIWDYAFSTKALQSYEPIVREYGLKLKEQIAKRAGQPMELRNWFYFLTFDMMGALTFAKSFGMLQRGEWHGGPKYIRNAIKVAAFSTPAPWLAHLAFNFPFISIIRDWNTMAAYCLTEMQERMQSKSTHHDITRALLDASEKKGSSAENDWYMLGDSMSLIVAGSDTVAPTLTHLFYRLCRHPEIAETLKKQIRALPDLNDSTLRELPYLDGCIKETLRLHPAVPTGGMRTAPAEGVTILGQYIPGNTTICIPQYSIQRSPDCFVRPEEFIPERWYPGSDLILDRSAYFPFSIGRYDCVGKQLGYAQLRSTTSIILQSFDFKPAHPEKLMQVESDMVDTFTTYPGSCELIFEPVKAA